MSCVFELLDEGPSGRIEVCRGCGCVAVHVGPMTMRLDRAHFAHFASTVRRAQQQLDRAVTAGVDVSYGETPRGQA